jgi:outer membrane protein TolC
VAAEVRQAAVEWHAKSQLLVLGRERVAVATARQRDAEEKAKSGGGSFLEVLSANLEAYKARAQLVEDLMGWHAARARLKQAQGVLVLECCTP